MKKIFKLMPVAFGLLALTSCSNDDLFSDNNQPELIAGEGEMIATLTDATRNGVSDNGLNWVWAPGDTYVIYDQNLAKNRRYTLKDGYEGFAAGVFEITPATASEIENMKYGVYPYNQTNKIELTYDASDEPKATLFMPLNVTSDGVGKLKYADLTVGTAADTDAKYTPAKGQDLAKGQKASEAAIPLWGKVNNPQLNARAISFAGGYMTSILRIKLAGLPDDAKKLVIKSEKPGDPSEYEILAGSFKADITKQTDVEFSGDVDAPKLEVIKDATGNSNVISIDLEKASKDEVVYVALPAGIKSEWLSIDLFDDSDPAVSLNLAALGAELKNTLPSGAGATLEQGKVYNIEYTIKQVVNATSLKEVNKAIADYLKTADTDKGTILFAVDGSGTAVATATEDNMLLIPATQKNIIVEFNDGLDFSSGADFYVAEAGFGRKIDENKYQGDCEPSAALSSYENAAQYTWNIASVATRKFSVKIASLTGTSPKAHVFAPNSSVAMSNSGTSDFTFESIYAATAATTFTLGDADASYSINATDLTTYGGVEITEKGKATTLNNNGAGTILVDGEVETLNNGANGGVTTINGNVTDMVNNSNSNVVVTKGANVTGTTVGLTNKGTGEVRITGATVALVKNTSTGAVTVAANGTDADEDGDKVNAAVTKIVNTGAATISVAGNDAALTIENSSKDATITVDGQVWNAGPGKTKVDGTKNNTITDVENTISYTTEASTIAVSNTTGVTTITNYGGAVTLNNVLNQTNKLTQNSANKVTLTDSYTDLEYTMTAALEVEANGKSGLGQVTDNANLNITDKTWTVNADKCEFNYNGDIHTCAQLAALTSEPVTTLTKITLKRNLNFQDKPTWAGIIFNNTTDDVVFDGAGYEISNLRLKAQDQAGLIKRSTGKKLTVQSLKLTGVKLVNESASYEAIAALVGMSNRGLDVSDVTIKNVDLKNGGKANSQGTGVVIGKINTASKTTFTRVIVDGANLTGHYYLGGAIGLVSAANGGIAVNDSHVKNLALTVKGDVEGGDPNNFEASKSGTAAMFIGGVAAATAVSALTIDGLSTIQTDYLTNDKKKALYYLRNNDGTDSYFFGGCDWIGYSTGTITTFTLAGKTQTSGTDYNKFTTIY